MPTTGFHSEWVTIHADNDHRILLESRAGHPGRDEHFIATVAAELVDRHSSGDARVVKVYYDDKSSTHHVTVASTVEADAFLGELLCGVLQQIFASGNPQVAFVHVAAGNRDSDHYHHMEHLSVGADVAVDRWKHRDAGYMSKVESPR